MFIGCGSSGSRSCIGSEATMYIMVHVCPAHGSLYATWLLACLQAIPLNTPWNHEPALSLLRDILEVGEALATFGNCQFPEHSNEHRAILAADFKQLMQEFLRKLGSVFVPGAVSNLPSDVQVRGDDGQPGSL